MKKWLLAGSALLIIQLSVAVALNFTARDFGAFTPHQQLLALAPADVDSITISGPEKEVTLRREKAQWQLPDYYKAPADNKRISALLEKLSTLKQGLVVATSSGAAKRFKVSNDDFERHIILRQNDTVLADFFLGTSPGFKKAHARLHDRTDVITVALNNYDFDDTPDKWLDPEMFRIEPEQIIGVSMGDIELDKAGNEWRLAGLADNEEIEPGQVKNLLGKIGSLRVMAIVDPAAQPDLTKGEPALLLSVTLQGNRARQYTFTKETEKTYHLLQASDYDYLCKVDSWQVDELGKFSKSSLVKSEAATKP